MTDDTPIPAAAVEAAKAAYQRGRDCCSGVDADAHEMGLHAVLLSALPHLAAPAGDVADDHIAEMLCALRTFLREERLYAGRVRAEEQIAGRVLTGGELRASRDGADMAHAFLLEWTEDDCTAAIKRLKRRSSQAAAIAELTADRDALAERLAASQRMTQSAQRIIDRLEGEIATLAQATAAPETGGRTDV